MLTFKKQGLVTTIVTSDFQDLLEKTIAGLKLYQEQDSEWDYSNNIKKFQDTLDELLKQN